jgi:hypothetical protein
VLSTQLFGLCFELFSKRNLSTAIQTVVQVATGSARHASFQALLSLQQELCLSELEKDAAFTGKLSRVVTKLFSRAIKAEEASGHPYSTERLDMEALVCSVEDVLTACEKVESKDTQSVVCVEMVEMLVRSIIDAHGTKLQLLQIMDELGIDREESALGVCVVKVTASLGNQAGDAKTKLQIDGTGSIPVDSISRALPTTPSRDVASLVARLGSAPSGAERESALEAIRVYKSTFGGEELDAHLQQLSGAFRDFIEDQLKGDPAPQQQPSLENGASSVTERIRNLRSRLRSTETSTQPSHGDGILEPVGHPSPRALRPAKSDSPDQIASNQSRLVRPSPSKLPSPGQSRLPTYAPSSSSAQSLRDRLALRQASRTSSSTDFGDSSAANSVGGAAVLRARLEAVKQTKQQDA